MILSKAVGNVLRVSGVQAAMRYAIMTIHNEDLPEELLITAIDMKRSIITVKYSVECLLALVMSLDDQKVIIFFSLR